jgi:hypothetical protein
MCQFKEKCNSQRLALEFVDSATSGDETNTQSRMRWQGLSH